MRVVGEVAGKLMHSAWSYQNGQLVVNNASGFLALLFPPTAAIEHTAAHEYDDSEYFSKDFRQQFDAGRPFGRGYLGSGDRNQVAGPVDLVPGTGLRSVPFGCSVSRPHAR